jgi:hypothetical protein
MRRKVAILVTATVVALGGTAQGKAPVGKAAAAPWEIALAQVEGGRYAEAVAALDTVILALQADEERRFELARTLVVRGAAKVGLGEEDDGRDDFRRALAVAARVPGRAAEIFEEMGGTIEEPVPSYRREHPPVPLAGWVVAGIVGVGAPAVTYAVTRKPAGGTVDRDSDGDGLSPLQGDCNDGDATVSPNGQVDVTFDLGLSGAVACSPGVGRTLIKVRNGTCTLLQADLVAWATKTRSDGASSGVQFPYANATPLSWGKEATLYTNPAALGCQAPGDPPAIWVTEQDRFVLRVGGREETRSQEFSYRLGDCPPCAQ